MRSSGGRQVTGVLDGRQATTHWNSAEALKRFRPEVQVDGDAIHVEDRGVWTSVGVTAGMDLALAMIEADHGRAVALAIAQRHGRDYQYHRNEQAHRHPHDVSRRAGKVTE